MSSRFPKELKRLKITRWRAMLQRWPMAAFVAATAPAVRRVQWAAEKLERARKQGALQGVAAAGNNSLTCALQIEHEQMAINSAAAAAAAAADAAA